MSDSIVVIEDSLLQAERLRTLLVGAGYDVHVAHDGENGLVLVESVRPRLVLTDVVMPGIDGLEVTRLMRSMPDLASIPVMVLTSSSAPADVLLVLEAGADDFISKPYDQRELLGRVARTLHRFRGLEGQRVPHAHHFFLSALEDAAAARRKADEANRTKDDFLATIAHELRTPLNAITGWATVLQTEDLEPSKRKRAIDVIVRNAHVQARLIEDLVDISRINAGQLHLDVQAISLGPVVEAARDAVTPFAASRGVSIELTVDGSPVVAGDAGRLQQVVTNLLSNAVKVSPRGSSVELRLTAGDGGAAIQVRDHGRGIPSDQLPFLFERFRQAHQRKAGEVGLGLGLAIVEHIVTRHGGRIVVKSEGLGHGAIFDVWLPESQARSGSLAPSPRGDLDDLHVLVVDDEEDMRELVAAALRRAGATVLVAGDVPSALVLLRADHVVVSDLAMPGADGYDFVRAIRARTASAGGTVPVVALTARGPAVRDRALAAGFDNFVMKPVETSDLIRVVAMMATHARRAG